MTLRNLARIGATGVLAVSALGLAATPALAADVDFAVTLSGTTIAAGATEKLAKLTFTNNGTTRPEKAEVTFDSRGLDSAKVTLDDALFDDDPTCKRAAAGLVTCTLDEELIPAPGTSADAPFPLTRKAGATGAAGKLTVTVKVAGDTVKANDSRTAEVTLEGDNGADLAVYAEDVTEVTDQGVETGKGVQPGAVAPLVVFAFNQGDLAAAGMKMQIKLPAQTTFAAAVRGCTATADKRTLNCTFKDATLLPQGGSERPEDGFLAMGFPVQVAADAKGPVSLKDGVVTATAIAQQPVSARRSKAAATLPEGFSRPTAAQVAEIDVDRSDNTDSFAVLVAGTTGGNAGGDTGEDDGNGEGGPGLPNTGASGLTIGAAGLAAVATGLGLFYAARRRRVVLVAPGDDK